MNDTLFGGGESYRYDSIKDPEIRRLYWIDKVNSKCHHKCPERKVEEDVRQAEEEETT